MSNDRLLKGTERSLVLRLFQRRGWIRGWLHDRPFSSYLSEYEDRTYLYETTQPIIVRHSDNREEIHPDKRYRTIIAFTDKRLLIVVGHRPENEREAVSWNYVDSFAIEPRSPQTKFRTSVEPNLTKTEVSFEFTTPNKTIRLDSIAKYDTNEILDNIAPFLSEQTGIEDWNGKERWETARENYQEAKKKVREKKERRTS